MKKVFIKFTLNVNGDPLKFSAPYGENLLMFGKMDARRKVPIGKNVVWAVTFMYHHRSENNGPHMQGHPTPIVQIISDQEPLIISKTTK